MIALAGNPNVGKSSVFNQLTGLRQHTGNWAGKTVDSASGICVHGGKSYTIADIPGTYSLLPHSREEEVARDFILLENPDAVIVVCDASCLERNLNLVLQTTEITNRVVVCVNLMDEARRHNIKIDLEKLSEKLGVPVIGTVARSGKGLSELMDAANSVMQNEPEAMKVRYTKPIEDALSVLSPVVDKKLGDLEINPRWVSLRLLEHDKGLRQMLIAKASEDITIDPEIYSALRSADAILSDAGLEKERIPDMIVSCTVLAAEDAANGVIQNPGGDRKADRRLDRIVTSRIFGIPIMLALLALVFWITVSAANLPTSLLSEFFGYIEKKLLELALYAGVPESIYNPLIFGVYHVLTWVVAVMLPPMAIFFPLFTLLEDLGYLPRIAFNLDKCFKKCSACGKQALTMCMGFGCNAVGVIGCRIIDSPRERLIAILTNCFVPCNGRFPTLISVITMFLIFSEGGAVNSILGALVLTLAVLLGIFATLLVSKLLSKTILRGQASSFTLELPPYRKPDVAGIIVRSVLDRTLFVLSRAVMVAAPAGLVIWLLANTQIGGATLLYHASSFLDPFARMIGMDGTILLAFMLGFPANEIVIPLVIMSYMSAGMITDSLSLLEMKNLFIANGWTWVTAINVILFSLMHWPCSTTLLTIKKETGSIKWTLAALAVPTLAGILVCFLFTSLTRLL